MAQSLKLLKHTCIKGTLICKSGLRIGGTESEIGIGSAENPVIKDAQGIPYIPGSSLKGKLRSMLEYKYKRVNEFGVPCGCGQEFSICPVCTLFGPHKNNNHSLGPSRVIVRDSLLTEKSMKDWEASKKEGKDFTEIKMETSIDRRTGMAARGSLRQQERVNPGTEFQMNISVRIFEGDEEKKINDKKITDVILEGIRLIGNDTLGGSGTRGYGWVEIKDIEVKDC
jgi:CRISPR-associated protein Csm3